MRTALQFECSMLQNCKLMHCVDDIMAAPGMQGRSLLIVQPGGQSAATQEAQLGFAAAGMS